MGNSYNTSMSQKIIIPDYFKERYIQMKGERGREWIERLPQTITSLLNKWKLTLHEPFHLTYNYVAPVQLQDGSDGVLKVMLTGEKMQREFDALNAFNGDGAVIILKFDSELDALLLERAIPGISLKEVKNDEEATRQLIKIMNLMKKQVPEKHIFYDMNERMDNFKKHLDRFEGTSGPIDQELFDKAYETFKQLAASQGEEVVLHGDLHHGNVVSAQRASYLAIDPKGMIGEPEYECGALLRNQLPKDRIEMKKILERRIDQIAEEMGYDKERIRLWGFSQAVLSMIWLLEDHGEVDPLLLTCAEVLAN
jgi:streptomycin 6-kinase